MDDPAQQTKKIDPTKIDIYAAPRSSSGVSHVQSRQSSSVVYDTMLPYVSAARQFLWKYNDSFQGRYVALKTNSSSIAANVTEFIDSAQKDPSILARPGLVGGAYVGGLIAPGRGRKPLQRLLFSTGGVTIAAAILYPSQMLDAAKQEMDYIKAKTTSLWSPLTEDKKSEKQTPSLNTENTMQTTESPQLATSTNDDDKLPNAQPNAEN